MSPSLPNFLSEDYDRTEPLRGSFGDDCLYLLDSDKASRSMSHADRLRIKQEADAQALRIRRRQVFTALSRGNEVALIHALAQEVDLELDDKGCTALFWLLENFETCADPMLLESVIGLGASLDRPNDWQVSARDLLERDEDLRKVVQALLVRTHRTEDARSLGDLEDSNPQNEVSIPCLGAIRKAFNDLPTGRSLIFEMLGAR